MLRQAILGISVGVILTFGAENASGQTLTKADLAKPLSPEATKIVVRHLTQVVDLLLRGGPDPDLPDEEKAQWTLEKTLSRWNGTSVDANKWEYLDQYRSAFLHEWTQQLRNQCSSGKAGGLDISGGMGGSTCCFQPAGTTRGHYDAQSQASWLFLSVSKERSARSFARLEASDDADKEWVKRLRAYREESHDIEPTYADIREYLNDYRRMFLTTWLDKLQNSSTWVDNYHFQSAGTANGFYAAQHLARNVRSVRGAPGASPSDIRYAPRAAIGSLRYLRANFSAESETTGASSGGQEDSAE